MAKAGPKGRGASRPGEIPKAGWRDILVRTWHEMTRDHVSIVAAGVAVFGLLALFPAITALISIAGLMLDPAEIEARLEQVASVLPEDAAGIIQGQAREVASSSTGASIAAIGGILLALYSASKGMKSLMEGMNIAYDEEESRGFLKLNAVALGLTLFLIVGLILALGATVILPAALGFLGLSDTVRTLITVLQWPLLAVLAILGLAVVYRFGPSREQPRWRWISPGAVAATVLWIVASIGFSIYVANFGNFNETYGALGGVIILLTWLWVSAMIVLMGAELNSEAEHQTRRDTTTGEARARGERGAVKADHVGRSP